MLELGFHALLLPVTAWALWFVGKRRNARALMIGIVAVAAVGTALAVGTMLVKGGSRMFGARFAMIGLLAQGIFVHGPIVMVGAGILLRREAKGWARASSAMAVALGVVAVDAWFVEPTWLEVTHHRITSAKLERPLRIVVLADIQTESVGEYERRVIRAALDQKPDLIVLPGDYIQLASVEEYDVQAAKLNQLLADEGFGAPLGGLAVEGNVEWLRNWRAIFAGFDVLTVGETTTVAREGIWLTGLSFVDSFDRAASVEERPGFHIAVGHAPNFALGDVQADLLIAGHTHGGQVRIPFFGPPMTLSLVPRDWAAGLTELDGGRTLVVSRGIGMEGGNAPRIRFFCRPELAVIDVVPASRPPARANR